MEWLWDHLCLPRNENSIVGTTLICGTKVSVLWIELLYWPITSGEGRLWDHPCSPRNEYILNTVLNFYFTLDVKSSPDVRNFDVQQKFDIVALVKEYLDLRDKKGFFTNSDMVGQHPFDLQIKPVISLMLTTEFQVLLKSSLLR